MFGHSAAASLGNEAEVGELERRQKAQDCPMQRRREAAAEAGGERWAACSHADAISAEHAAAGNLLCKLQTGSFCTIGACEKHLFEILTEHVQRASSCYLVQDQGGSGKDLLDFDLLAIGWVCDDEQSLCPQRSVY